MVLRPRNSNEVDLMSLYGVDLVHEEDSQPKLGSWVQMELNDGFRDYLQTLESDEAGNLSVGYQPKRDDTRPSLRRLGYHLGYMHKLQDLSTDLVRRSQGTIAGRDLPTFLIDTLEAKGIREFFQQVVEPAREDVQLLAQPFYLYCVPALIKEPDLLNGGHTIERRGTLVLTLLPKTVHVAQYYQVDEAVLRDMAREVVWVVKKLVSNRVIRTPEQLIKAMDHWPAYVERQAMQKVSLDLQQNYPHLITDQSVQVLLPAHSQPREETE